MEKHLLILRDLKNKDLEDLLVSLAETLDSQVDVGIDVIEVIADNPKDDFTDSTLIVLLRDYIEFLDGVSVLIRHNCSAAAIPIMRSMFEYYLSIRFILQKNTQKRALAYQVATLKAKLRDLNKTNIRKGAQKFENILAKNSYKVTFKAEDNTRKVTSVHSLLNSPPYKDVHLEWKKAQEKIQSPPNWFSLFGGPENIKQLAEQLGVIAEYEIFYREWSSTTHATGSFKNFSNKGIKQIRLPDKAQTVCTWAMTWTHKLMNEILKYYKPDELKSYLAYYLEVRDIYKRVTSKEPLIRIIEK